MFPKFKAWLIKQLSAPEQAVASTHSTATGQSENGAAQSIVPFDENLLDRSRTQWQFGDWDSLAKLDRDTLQHHPDRAKLALLAAAAHAQKGDSQTARQFTQLAQDWGCSKKLISQVLIAGVYNSIGRAAATGNQQYRALQHFENAIKIGVSGSDIRLLTQARMSEQYSQIKLVNQSAMVALEVNRSGEKNNQNAVDDIKIRDLEKNYASLWKKEIIRLQKIIENTHSISGLKQPLTHKVFCIGSNKTGTTSLDSAMRTLGFTTMPEDLAYQYLTLVRDEQAQEKTFKRLLEKETDKFNFFEDLPFCFKNNYKLIDEFYTDAHFILSIRDPEIWFSSCIRWIGKLDCETVYSGLWDIRFTIENKEEIISRYNKRNTEIRAYFSNKPGKLLVIQIEQANYVDLIKFLSLESSLTANLDFPIENINDLKH